MTASSEDNPITNYLSRLILYFLGLPWSEIIGELWKSALKALRGQANDGMYEVLDYETTLELRDPGGKKATLKKREKVRFLQDNIIAYQDQAWGDGEYLRNYRCMPGKPVDRYRAGYKTYILISLREVKNRGDVGQFKFEWGIQNGFLKPDGFWATEISHRTKRIQVDVIFPKSRPPTSVSIFEKNSGRTHSLGEDAITQLPNRKWQVTWKKSKPRLYEQYLLKWNW
ncbi:hypothetical protein ACFLZW_03340 [Chloroflexota bacterium]